MLVGHSNRVNNAYLSAQWATGLVFTSVALAIVGRVKLVSACWHFKSLNPETGARLQITFDKGRVLILRDIPARSDLNIHLADIG